MRAESSAAEPIYNAEEAVSVGLFDSHRTANNEVHMKPVSDDLFAFHNFKKPKLKYQRCSAKDLSLNEAWLRDAIFANPELVIGPCRAAEVTSDDWFAWRKEFAVEVGSIDVLLLSSQGRLAVVETKLAHNPELRRSVLAQVLDYLAHLADRFQDGMPEIPSGGDGRPVASVEDVQESVSNGDILVIVASDEVDPRVAKLSQSLLSDHLVKQWDLVLVDVALYRPASGSGAHIVVPHVRTLVQSEPRQVVRVVVEGETPKAKIEIQRIVSDDVRPTRQKWDESRFFRRLEAETSFPRVRQLAINLRDLAHRYPQSVKLDFGTGKNGSMVLKRNNAGLVEIFGSGQIRFRPSKFGRALGKTAAKMYMRSLEKLIPAVMSMEYPKMPPQQADKTAPSLLSLLRKAITSVERG